VIPIRRKTLLLFLLPLAFFLSQLSVHPVVADEPLPAPRGLINDFADIIPPAYEEQMNSLAHEVLEKADATLTVVTIKDIGGANIDEFTNRLYEMWGVGKKGEDRGAMILVAFKERMIRIEVGYGLEGVIPDGLAGQIRDQVIVPYLKKDEFGPGLSNGLSALAGIIAKDRGIELVGKPATTQEGPSKESRRAYGIFPFLFLLFVLFSPPYVIRRRPRGFSRRGRRIQWRVRRRLRRFWRRDEWRRRRQRELLDKRWRERYG